MSLTTEEVLDYLPAFGYQYTDDDHIIMRHAIERVVARILAFTNQPCLPKGLEYEAINMAVGEFLYIKKSMGALNIEGEDGNNGGIHFANIIKQFTEGDTNVSANMAGARNEALFEDMIDKMRFGDPIILEHYRRLHW